MKRTKRIPILIGSLIYCITLTVSHASPAYTNAWDVDLPRNPHIIIDVWRGETIALTPRTGITGLPSTAEFCWQTPDMGDLYWVTNAVVNATGDITVAWNPSMDNGSTTYFFFFRAGGIYRPRGTIRMQGSPGATPNLLSLPVPRIDFDLIEVLNIPWATPADVEAATASLSNTVFNAFIGILPEVVTNYVYSPSAVQAATNIEYSYIDAYMDFIDGTIPSGTVFRVATEVEWASVSGKAGLPRVNTLLPPEAFGASAFSAPIISFDSAMGSFQSPDSMLGGRRSWWILDYSSGTTSLSMIPDGLEEVSHDKVWEVIETQIVSYTVELGTVKYVSETDWTIRTNAVLSTIAATYANSNWVESVVSQSTATSTNALNEALEGLVVEEQDPKGLHKTGGKMSGGLTLAESGITFQGVNIETNFTFRAEWDGTNLSFNVYMEAK